MIQCALRTKIKHISALSALGTDVLFLHLDICGVALNLHYVVDVDIKSFFDNVSHGKLLKQMWTMGMLEK